MVCGLHCFAFVYALNVFKLGLEARPDPRRGLDRQVSAAPLVPTADVDIDADADADEFRDGQPSPRLRPFEPCVSPYSLPGYQFPAPVPARSFGTKFSRPDLSV